MTYELCKKLKEAGFPQKGKIICKHGLSPNDVHGHLTPEYAAKEPDFVCTALTAIAPTLDELIDACGDNHFELERDWFNNKDKWRAITWWDGNVMSGFGSISEEAVANLWLALNKKP